ncbi:hypothetical protein PPROV_000051500 [Pycnococcus provasolii]|uniref:Uncharacterized protein n=1 Tax=Pycnococcus provasolii TaxID=41880 RepID=A0A830H566_9CHLO|nr:hypothetical protein PPROV_000051500 [Pycnococcus provasolii]
MEYNCSGVIVPSTVYEAVKRGCTRDCSFYGADTHTFMCGTMLISADEHAVVLGGSTQYCLCGVVEMSGWASSSFVGGALTLRGGSSSGESEMSRGGDVELAAGMSARGVGGSGLVSSGFSETGTSRTVLVASGQSYAGASTGGAGGDIRVATGSGDTGDGGSVVVSAGDTSAASYASGDVRLGLVFLRGWRADASRRLELGRVRDEPRQRRGACSAISSRAAWAAAGL